jgi:transcriptional regulator with XRE-family HTH domain
MTKTRVGAEGDLYRHVGHQVRRLREGANLKQEELSVRVGISRASIANVEAGRQAVPLHILLAIARTLETGLESLLPSTSSTRDVPEPEHIPSSVRKFIRELAVR